jgi:ligand-binding SRPBCC domain-containing protein
MIDGPFTYFRHVHEFQAGEGGTVMHDTLTWTSPLGLLGTIADVLFLKRYLYRLVCTRNAKLKELAGAI